MNRNRWLLVLIGLIVGVLISGRIALRAQDGDLGRGKAALPAAREAAPAEAQSLPPASRTGELAARDATNPGSIQDALLRPYHFPFSKPTPLFQVCAHLKETLKGSVVLDLWG